MVSAHVPWNGIALEPEGTPEPCVAAAEPCVAAVVEYPPEDECVEDEAASTYPAVFEVEGCEEPSVVSHELDAIEENGGALPLEGAPPHQLSMTGLVSEKLW